MSPEHVRMVQESFEAAAGLGEKVAEIFYEELFTADPSLEPMFKGDMREQRKKLLATLAMVVRSLHAPEKIIGAAEALAVKHVDYGVKPEHYTLVGFALLRTLKRGLGEAFTPALCEAWVSAYGLLSGVMKRAAYGADRSAPRAA